MEESMVQKQEIQEMKIKKIKILYFGGEKLEKPWVIELDQPWTLEMWINLQRLGLEHK